MGGPVLEYCLKGYREFPRLGEALGGMRSLLDRNAVIVLTIVL
jgi:hypothetical protein